jgi:hypothetical protein
MAGSARSRTRARALSVVLLGAVPARESHPHPLPYLTCARHDDGDDDERRGVPAAAAVAAPLSPTTAHHVRARACYVTSQVRRASGAGREQAGTHARRCARARRTRARCLCWRAARAWTGHESQRIVFWRRGRWRGGF